MADSYLPPVEFLRECFSYDPETGVIRWKHRPLSHFERECDQRGWNDRYAGQETFTHTERGGYLRAEFRYEGKRIRTRAHRVAYKLVTGEEPEHIDHRDNDTQNNRFGNLRPAMPQQNQQNRPGKRTSKLPKCVSFENGRYRAYGQKDGRKVHLGSHDTPEEAHAAWCRFAEPLHGEFFNPGNPARLLFA